MTQLYSFTPLKHAQLTGNAPGPLIKGKGLKDKYRRSRE